MAEAKIFAGPRVRRIRQRLERTQTAMAAELGISPSYLNLIERNQRPLTAQLVLKFVGTYEVGVEELQPSGEGTTATALREVFADPLLAEDLPGPAELIDVADMAPNAAMAMVKLYRAFREHRDRLSDLSGMLGSDPGASTNLLPADAVRQIFETVPWCFPALERAAERIIADLGESRGRMEALEHLLQTDHALAVQVLPVERMPVWRKRIDRHSGRLFVSERLTRAERAELLAQELVLRREAKVLDEEVTLLKVEGDEARRLARLELARYTALAVLMPYERFLRAAERVSYDPMVLEARFEVGFAQVAHRLVSLQDTSNGRQKGVQFFALEVDRAGTLLRKIGAKGFPTTRFGGACPKLGLFEAFAQNGEIVAERVATPAGDVFFTLSRTIEAMIAGAGERPRVTALLLGTEDRHGKAVLDAASDQTSRRGAIIDEADALANRIAHARLLPDVQRTPPVPIGPACRLCERSGCVARSAPPLTRPQQLDEAKQGFGVFGLT
jgi:predicted transcriptional regulator/DNA-binding XRE family transcriptional regulator